MAHKHIRMLFSWHMYIFNSLLDAYLRSIADLGCRSGLNNSLHSGDCINGGHYADVLATN